MRATVAIIILAAVSGCASDPCAGESGSCITAHINGNASGLAQLAITVDQPTPATQRTATSQIKLPAVLAITLPSGTTGAVDVRIDGYTSSALVASDEHVVTLSASGRGSQTFTLNEGAVSADDMSVVSDLGGGDLGAECDGPCPVVPVCGNGIVETGEVCDDGNTTNGDGCDPTCHFQNVLSRIAGHADANYSGYADGSGSEARFRSPAAITTDGTALYVGDNCSIRKIVNPLGTGAAGGVVSTLAGLENDCQTMDGIGTAARFLQIQDLQWMNVGSAGALYVSTGGSLRKLDLANNQVITQAVTVGDPNGVGSDGAALLLADGTNGIRSMDTNTGALTMLATEAQVNAQCTDIAYSAGYYLACDDVITRLVPGATPTLTTFAGGGSGCTDNNTGTMAGLGLIAHIDAAGGVLYVSDSQCQAIRAVSTTGAVTTAAGTLGTAGHNDDPSNPKMSTFNNPQGIVAITDGVNTDLYITDTGNFTVRYKVNGTAIVAGVHPGTGMRTYGTDPLLVGPVFVTPASDGVYVSSLVVFGTAAMAKVDLTTGMATEFNASAAYAGPVIGSSLYASNVSDYLIYNVPLDGSTPLLFAGVSGQPTNSAMDGPREVAILHAQSVVTDGVDLYFADTTNTIRKIDMMSGNVSTVAGDETAPVPADGIGTNAHFDQIGGLTYANGSLYIVDGNGSLIRQLKISTSAVTTIAGKYHDYGAIDGLGLTARFGKAAGITTDGMALFITDPGNGWNASNTLPGDGNGPTVREMELATGMVSTMIGTRGQWSFRAGVGTQARLNWPFGIAYDAASKTLVLTDYSEEVLLRIR